MGLENLRRKALQYLQGCPAHPPILIPQPLQNLWEMGLENLRRKDLQYPQGCPTHHQILILQGPL